MPDAADVESLWPVIEAFRSLGIRFHVGGSVAGNMYGPWRSTMDTDLVAEIGGEHVVPLTARLDQQYYIDAEMIRDAIRARSSFNVIHNGTAQKVDVFIAKRRPFDFAARERVQMRSLTGDGRFEIPVASAEDLILSKLEWYRLGGEMSERQWNDIRGVLMVQGPTLDRTYLVRWADELGVDDLLRRAYADAGLNTD